MSDPHPKFVHDDRFVEPFANRPHTVLGKRLFPFSLWTQFNLELAQSPFLLGHRVPTLHDLWVAVQCASTPWTPEHYSPNLALPPMKSWRGLRWQLGMTRFRLPVELAKFYAYLADFATGPRFWANDHKSEGCERVRDLDDNLELASFMETNGYSVAEVWTMPLGQLRWRSAVVSRIKGSDTRIWTAFDEARDAKYRAELEAQLAARAAELLRTRPGMTQEAAERIARDEHQARKKANIAGMKPPIPRPPKAEPL